MLRGRGSRCTGFGYALVTSRAVSDRFELGLEHLQRAGPLLRVTFELRGDVGFLRSNDARSLGSALPFVAEFWRSSIK
jgi:hypothetical protein